MKNFPIFVRASCLAVFGLSLPILVIAFLFNDADFSFAEMIFIKFWWLSPTALAFFTNEYLVKEGFLNSPRNLRIYAIVFSIIVFLIIVFVVGFIYLSFLNSGKTF